MQQRLLAHGVAAGLGQGPLDVLEPVIGAPKVLRQALAQVTDNQLGLGVAVEDAVGDETHDVDRDVDRKADGRTDEVLALGVDLVVIVAGRSRGVQVDGHIQLDALLPEHIVLGLVVEEVRLAARAGMLEVVQQRAVEAVLLDRALELLRRLGRVVHGEAGKGADAIAVVLDLVGNPVVDVACVLLGLGGIRDALDARHGQGVDGVTDAMLVGQLEPLAGRLLDLAHVPVKVLGGDVQGSLGATRVR